jgi:hypothetical protein
MGWTLEEGQMGITTRVRRAKLRPERAESYPTRAKRLARVPFGCFSGENPLGRHREIP